MRITRQLLIRGNIDRCPVKKKLETRIDESDEDGRVQNRLPHGSRSQNRLSPKRQIQDIWAGLDERVDGSTSNALWAHGRRQGNEDIHLLIQRGMNAERGKRLCGALTKPNIAQARLMGGLENIRNRIRDIVKGKLIHAEVPKLG